VAAAAAVHLCQRRRQLRHRCLEGLYIRHDGDPIPVTVRVTWTDETEGEVNGWTSQWTRTHVCVVRESAPPVSPVLGTGLRRQAAPVQAANCAEAKDVRESPQNGAPLAFSARGHHSVRSTGRIRRAERRLPNALANRVSSRASPRRLPMLWAMAVNRSRRAKAARRRRRRMDRVECDLTDEQWPALKLAWGGCAHCGVTDKPLERDCVLALSRGGRYTLDNIVPACGSCNASKCNDEVTGWLRRKRFDERAFLVRYVQVTVLALRFPAVPQVETETRRATAV
jgi:5-methylcytosine-specific restriction endonuclease McrA